METEPFYCVYNWFGRLKTSSEVELMETINRRLPNSLSKGLKTSSEVELMETDCGKRQAGKRGGLKTSSEVELMETYSQPARRLDL